MPPAGPLVQEALDLYYSALPAQVKALPPALSLGALPLLTAVLALYLARCLWAAATARPVPTIEVPLSPGACVSACVVLWVDLWWLGGWVVGLVGRRRLLWGREGSCCVWRVRVSNAFPPPSNEWMGPDPDVTLHRIAAITQDDGVTEKPSASQELLVRARAHHVFRGFRNDKRGGGEHLPIDPRSDSLINPSPHPPTNRARTGQGPPWIPAVLRPLHLAAARGGAHHDGQGRACVQTEI